MTTNAKSAPVLLIFSATVLTAAILVGAAVAIHGFFIDGWLLPYWAAMKDAQAAIVAQLLFFLAAAWASVIVPLLFREQLQTLEEAAKGAKSVSLEVAEQLKEMATKADAQFKEISRYQQLALGYVADEGLLADLKDKKGFIDNAWTSVRPKVMEALGRLHGQTQNYIWKNRERTEPWWSAVEQSKALREYYTKFKAISDAKWGVSKYNSAPPELGVLRTVNDALKAIQDFDPSGEADSSVTLQSLADDLAEIKRLLQSRTAPPTA